ncbi:MAG: helix-turn-helix transcriptional regulator [Lachnospiraceae bacterium]|nr:helix-turn-helix transcriptional regulator [Lachnospiraceae bacterium]
MIKENNDFDITENAKEVLITKLTDELIFLRTKLGLSQDELSNLIGISRQTYSTLETKKRTMSWGTYLSLILVFDNNEQTHDIIRDIGIFPYMLFGTSESTLKEKKVMDFSGLLIDDVKDKLDDQALHAIETVIMLEYARCNKMSGDAVIKAFDGRRFIKITEQGKDTADEINLIKSGVDSW